MSRTEIPARSGWSGVLRQGQLLRVIDAQGGQAADLWAFNLVDVEELLSAHHTRVMNGEVYPRVGWTFYTNERRPILKFVDDTSPGRHDCLAAACDSVRYEQLGAGADHGSCEENLQAEALRHDFVVRHAPQPINVFANFRVTPEGALDLNECLSAPGDGATFEALMDCIVVLSACPQDIVPFQPGGPTDMAVEVYD
jgi:uncharacterized protein YcgI (DUF1989 family)